MVVLGGLVSIMVVYEVYIVEAINKYVYVVWGVLGDGLC